MTQHFQNELQGLKEDLSRLATRVEENLHRAIRAMKERSPELAKEALKADREVDRMEMLLEEEVLKVLALHQPVATDLRYVITVLKLNNELERIGDLTGNVAERALSILEGESFEFEHDFETQSRLVCQMVRKSLDAIFQMNREGAIEVFQLDDEVDNIHRNMYDLVRKRLVDDPRQVAFLLNNLSISKHLERIADHAENMASDILYMFDGEIIRHERKNELSQKSES
jgi:phosphate transport system protein